MMTTKKTCASLPIVDLHRAKDPTQRLIVARQLVKALETVGFLLVDNVNGFDYEGLLSNAQWFFNLSGQEKHRLSRKLWNPNSQNHYRGYFPLQPGETSYKEGFEIGQDVEVREDIPPFFTESNLWPKACMAGSDSFQQDMVTYYRAMLECGMEILRLTSLGSGLPEDWFQSMFCPNSLSTLRLLHYPPRLDVPENVKDDDNALSCSDHSDSGFVTLLATFNYGGLQIYWDGQWLAVPPRPNSLVMNIGDMLSTMSGSKFKATRHRVVDTGVDRFSVPFFFEPHYNADINRTMPRPQEEQNSSSMQLPVQSARQAYGPYLMEKMQGFAEYRDMLSTFSSISVDQA